MSGNFWVQRRQEARLHGFGLGLGLLLALIFHALLFWGPEVRYRPALEEAKVRRVLVARPYNPAPPPAPKPAPARRPVAGAGAGAEAVSLAPKPAEGLQPTPGKVESSGAEVGGGALFRRGLAAPERDTGAALAELPSDEPADDASPELSPDEWAVVMAELQQRGQVLDAKGREAAERGRGVGAGGQAGVGGGDGEGGGEGGFLDSRIRMTVVSYPPTSIEKNFPAVAYPDLRFRRKELQAGICRVYYRVWTDGFGHVSRSQLKTPATEEERERYAPFVDAVVEAVADWPFDRAEAEIHVDVLFEIE